MDRSSIIERLYELSHLDGDIVDPEEVSKLMAGVINGEVADDEAEVALRVIDPQYKARKFLKNLKGKPIHQSIRDYKAGKLSHIQIAKMVSSLVTQVLIQCETNSSVTCKELQVDALLEILSDYSSYGIEAVNTSLLDHLLDFYGWDD